MRRIALMLVLAVLVPAEVAQAGGWATVELGQAPSGLEAGKPWRVELIVKQHGVTPMEGVKPSITILDRDGTARTFAARPTGTIGHYVADVQFPAAGKWRAEIHDGFTDAVPHRISQLLVGEPTGGGAAAPQDAFPWAQAVMIAIVALLFLGGWLAAGEPRPARARRTARGATPRPAA